MSLSEHSSTEATSPLDPADLGELLKGEAVAGFGQLLDHLPDLVSGQSQVGGPEQLVELIFADEPVAVHVWRRDEKVS